MANGQKVKLYVEKQREFMHHKICDNGIQIYINVTFLNDSLLDLQKDIITDFLANFIDKAGHETVVTEDELADFLEHELENINIKLAAFVDKIDNIDNPFGIKGAIQIIMKQRLFVSLIGDVSSIIVRNNKTYYAANNDYVPAGNIDTFSDIIEGELQKGDKMVIVGTNYENVLDEEDMNELNDIRSFESKDIINFFEKLFTTKIEAEELCFVLVQDYKQNKHLEISRSPKKKNKKPFITQKTLIKHKYNITIGVLGLFVILLAISVISSLRGNNGDAPTYILEDGSQVSITIERIKKDINDFVQYPATDENKGKKYQEIKEQLAILEAENRWPDEVKKRKEFIQEKYYEGFNVVVIDSIDQSSNYFTYTYPFDADQMSVLGQPRNVLFNESLYIAGTKGAIIQGINQDVKGNYVQYNSENGVMQSCNFDLSKQGLYCFDDTNGLFRVTAGGVQPLTTQAGFFPGNIYDIGTFTSSNIYILHDNQSFEEGQKRIISKYSNKLGSYTDFGNATEYVNRYLQNETGQVQNFTSMSIDGTFLVREQEEKKLYQLWREPESVTELSSREIALLGGDNIETDFSNNVKVIQLTNSPYVYLFDKDNQNITVYNSNPNKTSTGKQKSYNLLYQFRLHFDKEKNTISDITVPEDNPDYMYILTEKGVYETNIKNFINQFAEQE